MSGVEDAIAFHKMAVLDDEANFTDDGEPIDEAAALQSGIVETAAYKTLVGVQCATLEDVQAKLDYFLTGSVGMRSPLVACLLAEEYGATYGAEDRDGANDGSNVVRRLLQSMVLAP